MRILLLLLIAFQCHAQIGVVSAISSSNKSSINFEPIPSPPAFTDTFVLIDAVILNSIETTEISGKHDLLVRTPYADRLRPNNFQGTVSVPYRLKSESDVVRTWVGGDVVTTAQQVNGMLNSPTYVYYYHLGFVGNSDPVTQTGITGMQLTAKAGGSNFIISDVVIKDVSFAGIQVNSSTATDSITNLDISFARIFGHNLDGEGFYLGNTSKTVYSTIENCTLTHCFVTDKGRDGYQFNNHGNLHVNHCTAYDVGKAAIASQQSLVQVQNTNGLIEDCIFWGAPEMGTIGTNGVTFRNCIFYANARGYINRMATDYVGSKFENHVAIIFDKCHFGSPNALAEAWRVQEDGCDVTFTNCTKDSNITNLYLEFRADQVTHTLSESGTTTAPSELPLFNSLDPDVENSGMILNTSYRIRKVGFRNVE